MNVICSAYRSYSDKIKEGRNVRVQPDSNNLSQQPSYSIAGIHTMPFIRTASARILYVKRHKYVSKDVVQGNA